MMDIPLATTGTSRSHSLHSLPGIQIDGPKDFRRSRVPFRPSTFNPITAAALSGSEPMAIPNAKDDVPPPLPPPRHIPDPDLALRYVKGRHDEPKTLPPIQPGSSLLAGLPLSSSSSRSSAPRRPSADGSRSPEPSKPSRNVSPSMDFVEASPRRDALKHMDEGYDSLPGSMPISHTGLRTQEPSWDASQGLYDSYDRSYDRSVLDKLKAAPVERHPRTMNTTLRPLRRPAEGGPGAEGPLASYTQSSPGTDRKDFGARPLPDPRASPASASGGMEDVQMRSGVTPDSAVSAMSGQSGFLGRSFLSPRVPPRQSSTLSSVAETEAGRRGSSRRSVSGSLPDAVNGGADHLPGGVYGQAIYAEPEPESCEETRMRRLRLGEPDRTPPRRHRYSPHSKAGRKRRASSPPRERDERNASGASGNSNELFHRRSSGHLPGRQTPPVNRFGIGIGSLSSSSSVTGTGSTVSSTGMTLLTNSLTSLSSHDRVSPASAALSPSSDLESGSPYVRSLSLNPSPHESLAKAAHHRTASDTRPSGGMRRTSRDESSHLKQHSLQRMHGVYICECCPKKPKKFDNEEDLRLHTTEKQYTCQYCNNRFKNKNEAERHQNSLHLRRHSWSCAALVDYKSAFHASPYKSSSTGSAAADVCGYCGEQFALPADWSARFEHLTNVHKFGECNKAKKFFRADHFRQHLKHSHAGTGGKWTNMLETACMKDEPPPERTSSSLTDGGGGVMADVIDEDPEGEI